ncbi:hypothetical protein [Halorubrum tebenquichense]|uniref:Uncharacterized protein n=1 Tax=Halorubrum tebenquichense DSM 14210 TaxID=1227485 RepID=M0DT25_9EURY|nr:hypothetical protein [Halorubrum tebenquichense]ELZ38635.1 hypothetical protein C472_07174 [Halorubrum tebenquichense DSM 14210]
MIDDPLPTPSGNDAESATSEGDRSEADPNARRSSDGDPTERDPNDRRPDAERPARESEAVPDRVTDPPPGSSEDGEVDDRESEPAGGGGDANGNGDGDEEESEPLEYRLERLRLWRTVATLAVVVGRLIRSL